MTTPERDAVTRARADLVRLTFPAGKESELPSASLALDAYRAALLAEVVAVVEGMDKFGPAERFDGVAMEQDNLATWINRYDALDRIRALTEAR
jgi:hypothetical protein